MKRFLEKHGLWVLLAIAVAAVTLAVLSVVSFTFAGSIAGAVIFGRGNSSKRKRYVPRPRA